ncbi:IucA/IucC family protein [Sphaerisporangium rhizosphaerae]|uniref:IucA/IucC family protein n=1 Tax=Sphaerisporangium rhizosphaerae TaxID=2269375 RepID=A0ABW2PKK5_9ACTN
MTRATAEREETSSGLRPGEPSRDHRAPHGHGDHVGHVGHGGKDAQRGQDAQCGQDGAGAPDGADGPGRVRDAGPRGGGPREPYLAARVLDALVREDYGGLASRMTRTKDGVQLVLPSGRRVRLTPGHLYQDFKVARGQSLTLAEVLDALVQSAAPGDAEGVAAFAEECRAALRAYELHDPRRDEILARLRPVLPASAYDTRPPHRGTASPPTAQQDDAPPHPRAASPADAQRWVASSEHRPVLPAFVRFSGDEASLSRTVAYETLAAFADHPVYPTSRARLGLADDEVAAYAPEFAPSFPLRWAVVPVERVTRPAAMGALPAWWPARDAEHLRFPVHPLTVAAVRAIPGVLLLDEPYLAVRPTLSMRTVEVDPRTHLKLPLTTSTLGARNRRSIKPGTLEDGARAELLLREILRREDGLDVLVADEQTYAHAGHDHLGWMLRRLPPGEIVPVAALTAPFPGGGRVIDQLAARYRGGEVAALLADYLRVLFTWNVRLFVTYGVALEAHQQNLALVFDEDAGPGAAMRLLVKDDDGLLASPERLLAAGLEVPAFADPRMLNGDPHALADVFVTITLHLAAAAVAFGAGHGELVAPALESALAEYGGDPVARLLRARTLDAARLVGKSMVSAGTLVARSRIVSADINKHYGASGPNYLRHHLRREADH